MARGRNTAVAALLAGLALARVAGAQSDALQDAVQRENAQVLYKAGNDARDAGDMKTAVAKYKSALALVQTPVIALALARAEIAIGQLIEGRQTLLGMSRIPVRPHESTLTTSAREQAAALAAAIEPRIPSMILRIAPPPGVAAPAVKIDGIPVPELAWNEPWKVNPGPHVVVVMVGKATAETPFSVVEGESGEVTPRVPAPQAGETPGPARPKRADSNDNASPVAVVAPSENRTGDVSIERPSPMPAYVAFGIGGAGIVVTAVFGVLALNERSALDRTCTGGRTDCPSSAHPDIAALHTDSIVSDVGTAVAATGVVSGVALLLFRHASPASRTKADVVHIEPWLNCRHLGVRGAF
jgi:hypothetical protein